MVVLLKKYIFFFCLLIFRILVLVGWLKIDSFFVRFLFYIINDKNYILFGEENDSIEIGGLFFIVYYYFLFLFEDYFYIIN